MTKIDLCDTQRNNLIAAAIGLQKCTMTDGTEVLMPGTDKRILIGNDAYLARVAAPASADNPSTAGAAGIQFRKKPVVIEAFQFQQPTSVGEAPEWLTEAVMRGDFLVVDGAAHITTLEGIMTAQPGDWIIRGVKGELYPCKPDIFAATYDPAAAPAAQAPAQVPTAAEVRTAVARAIWNIRREDEDRCDMELEDMGDEHSVWAEADAAIRALRTASKEGGAA